jgi:hypothetical protein
MQQTLAKQLALPIYTYTVYPRGHVSLPSLAQFLPERMQRHGESQHFAWKAHIPPRPPFCLLLDHL